MSLATALIKKIIEERNLDTWSALRKDYLPREFFVIYDIIQSHIDEFHSFPTMENLKLGTRDRKALEKLYIIDKEEPDTESYLLLEYLRNEVAQTLIFSGLTKLVDDCVTLSSPEESIQSVYDMLYSIEEKVENVKVEEDVRLVNLFESEDELEKNIAIGLNTEWDETHKQPSDALILIGGYRGAGKSLVCNNIAQAQINKNKNVIKFSLEMPVRQELQRFCSIATGVRALNLKYKDLTVDEWEKVALWWANRYENGYEIYQETYLKNRKFDELHALLVKNTLKEPVFNVKHTPNLSMTKFKAECLKILDKTGGNVGVIILDYLNKVKSSNPYSSDFDWKEQIGISVGLKEFAEDIKIPIIAPYQTQADGTEKWSKDILVPADLALTIEKGEDYYHFKCQKSRHYEEKDFTSLFDKESLRIGPENGIKITKKEADTQHDDEDTPFDI